MSSKLSTCGAQHDHLLEGRVIHDVGRDVARVEELGDHAVELIGGRSGHRGADALLAHLDHRLRRRLHLLGRGIHLPHGLLLLLGFFLLVGLSEQLLLKDQERFVCGRALLADVLTDAGRVATERVVAVVARHLWGRGVLARDRDRVPHRALARAVCLALGADTLAATGAGGNARSREPEGEA